MEICYRNTDAVILIPDISGFTKYIANSDAKHSQDNIALLLESILENNALNFEVSEIEGDAILFYSIKLPLSGEEIIQQCTAMFKEFHKIINKIRGACSCISCQSVNELSLKFILHFGSITSLMVKNYCKLYGKDLIIVHRLLKNNINSNEYILFTESFINHFNLNKVAENMQTTHIEDIGSVSFGYTNLTERDIVI